jgi:hypothetical protein
MKIPYEDNHEMPIENSFCQCLQRLILGIFQQGLPSSSQPETKDRIKFE